MLSMRRFQLILVSCLLAFTSQSQSYNREKQCGTDTVRVNFYHRKFGELFNYLAFRCRQAGKIGIRFDMGYVSHSYKGNTKDWLSRHKGGVFGIALLHDKITVGVRFKVASAHPRSQLLFEGDTLVYDADINPGKIDFYAGYSFNLPYNFAVEPYAGVTKHLFHVINEKELNRYYNIPSIHGFHAGLTLNKYFRIKDFHFLSVFASYTYGVADFKKVHPSLGSGYSDWSVGLAYKVMTNRKFLDKIN
jgi:hypothetical protein